MFDIDPPSPILRISDYRKGGVLGANPSSFAAQLDRYMAAKADRWARLHEEPASVDPALRRIRSLRIADGDLAHALDCANPLAGFEPLDAPL